MINSNGLFSILGITSLNISKISTDLEISTEVLTYYNNSKKIPIGHDMETICKYFQITPNFLKLKLGFLDNEIVNILSENSEALSEMLEKTKKTKKKIILSPDFTTTHGSLYQHDCIDFLNSVPDNSYDLIFADPPFNLNKLYPSKMDDALKEEEYILWQENWVLECIRVLKPGGALFVWNLPKWNTYLTTLLNSYLTFKHWIGVDVKYSLPIPGRLYPSHYSLLYYVKGPKAKTFHPDRLPMEICPNCQNDLRDYGGYKDKMNPHGVNLSDVWYDIPPVRHAKYKRRKGANELSLKLLDRIIEMSSNEGDTIFDPFGGSGTTYITAELKNRFWVGTEIGPLDDIINRFKAINEDKEHLEKIRENLNCLFTKKNLKTRSKLGLWTPESVRKKKEMTKDFFN